MEDSLIDALYDQRFRSVLESWLSEYDLADDDRHRVEQLAADVAEFDRSFSESVEELISTLLPIDPGLTWSSDSGSVDGRLSVATSPEAAESLVGALLGAGFVPMYSMSIGAEHALRRVRRMVTLIPAGGPMSAVTVTWGDPPDDSTLARLARPTIKDLQLVSLPAWSWWAYWGVKPIRLVGRGLGRDWARRPSGPFLATPMGLVIRTLDLVGLMGSDLLVDLGCGDGRVLVEAARRTGCRGLGVEIDPRLANLARQNVAREGLQHRIEVVNEDINEISLDDADVVFAFLPIAQVRTLMGTVLAKLPDGARVVVHEQERVDFDPRPDSRRLLVSDGGVTVAHVWTA